MSRFDNIIVKIFPLKVFDSLFFILFEESFPLLPSTDLLPRFLKTLKVGYFEKSFTAECLYWLLPFTAIDGVCSEHFRA